MRSRILISIILLLAAVLPARAYDFMVDGLCYDINSDGTSVEVTYDKLYHSYSSLSGELTIPSTVTYNGVTYSVTSIGDNAFRGCSGLTRVTIPNSVTSIGNWAFGYCSGLTSVTIPNSVTSIGVAAFYNCSGLTSVTIGNSVTSIGGSAFYGCTGLTSVTWNAKNCTDFTVKNAPFSDCAIQSFTFGDDVEKIPAYICNGMSKLTSVTIPNSVISIGNYAFFDCYNLTSVTIPNSVTSIGESAFWHCYGLKTVHISDIAAWCNINFDSDSSNPIYYAYNLFLNGKEVKDLVIPNSVTSIGNYAFFDCEGLTSVTIPNSVTSIGVAAFKDCTGLTSVTIGNSVTSIGKDAFERCSGLKSVTIPNSVTSIGSSAFFDCEGLTSVIIGNSVTEIGSDVFVFCDGLTSIKVESGNIVYDSRNNCNAIIETASNTLIQGCNHTTIPNSVTSIGDRAFYCCSGLTSVTIPNSVISIGNYAFFDCYNLTSVTIPNSVTSIGDIAFGYCSGLETIYSYIKDPTKVHYVDIFIRTSIKKIYVPKGTLSLYKTTWPWSDYLNSLEEMVVHGDLNGDQAVNSGDVSTLYTIIMNAATGSDGDINNDKAVNTGDVSSLYQIILGEEK